MQSIDYKSKISKRINEGVVVVEEVYDGVR